MRAREFLQQSKTEYLYRLRRKPHSFSALGSKGVTCVGCGEVKGHRLHGEWYEMQRAKASPMP